MACVKDDNQLSPSEKKIARAIEKQFLSASEIVATTGLAMFKVRSGLRTLTENNYVYVEDETYRLKVAE